jgi:hypothetical protein
MSDEDIPKFGSLIFHFRILSKDVEYQKLSMFPFLMISQLMFSSKYLMFEKKRNHRTELELMKQKENFEDNKRNRSRNIREHQTRCFQFQVGSSIGKQYRKSIR